MTLSNVPRVIVLIGFFLILSGMPGRAGDVQETACPLSGTIQEKARHVLHEDVTVEKITPAPLSGVCQVQVSMEGGKRIFYTDTEGSYFLFGHLVDAGSGRDFTGEAMDELTRLSADEMKQVESLTAFSAGGGLITVYYMTDLQCPYCREGEEALKKLIAAGDITVKFLLFPLESHEGAREQCVSLICDHKGLDEFDNGYTSDNQCPEGLKKVADTIAFMKERGISATPAYIISEGYYHIGRMNEETLRERLGLPRGPAAASDTDNKGSASQGHETCQ